jgi:pyridoxal 5'-phosphate synthase pdxT subunit
MVSPAGRPPLVGVFALQGDFERHASAWRAAGARVREVRARADFAGLDALSLPGGESTTMLRLVGVLGLRAELEQAVRTLPVFATCAGAILLGEGGEHLPAPPLGVMDFSVARNAYGRQVDSFEADLDCPVLGAGEVVRGVFIRAPRFTRVGPGLEVLATHDGEPVGVREGAKVALAFHPEMTDDTRLFTWFLRTVVEPARSAAARDQEVAR